MYCTMENPGFDPGASTLRTSRSSNWANPPCIPDGTWTRNLLLRREAPSPLGHRDPLPSQAPLAQLVAHRSYVPTAQGSSPWWSNIIPDGTWTRNLPLRRGTPCPLGHRDTQYLRRPGIEPGPHAWKARILTIELSAHYTIHMYIPRPGFEPGSIGWEPTILTN